ncbi:MAG: HAD-superfamily hydrolase, subfamily [Candidatus Saccharibacteria bacterium]|nr:HAD-superfamily hydrolase, subfamily [Candidatus Saccharibacteria bacterium]
MSKYKAIILDLDGTVVPSRRDGMPSEKVKQAIAEAQKHVKVCLATGRPLYLSKHIMEELNITEPCVVDGGAEVVEAGSGRILFKKYISVNDQREVLKICNRFKLKLYTSENQYSDNLVGEETITKATAKLFLDGVSNSELVPLLQEFEAVVGVSAHPTTSWQEGDVVDIHITDAGATKKHAVEELMEILKLNPEEVIGVGDSHNDLPLLSCVGMKAVMGNSPPELKEVADYVAPDLEHDGVADVIQRFILS